MKKKNEITLCSSTAEYLTYVASTGDSTSSIEMRYEDENIWLTQKMMAELYSVDVRTINDHIKKVFLDNELDENPTIRNYRIVQNEVKQKNILKNNLKKFVRFVCQNETFIKKLQISMQPH